MENKKLLIIFVPVVALIIGYVVYTDYWPKDKSESVSTDQKGSFNSIDVKRDTMVKSKRERYKQKWEKENAVTRHIASDDDFFGKETKKDSLTVKPKKIDFTEPLDQQQKSQEKPKVVYVYKTTPVKSTSDPVSENSTLPRVTQTSTLTAVQETPASSGSSKRKVGFLTTTEKAVGVDQPAGGTDENAKPIAAVIQDESSVKGGSNILLRTTEDAIIGGKKIPRNTLMYGICSFTAERIKIEVSSIQVGNETINQKLHAYDLDGNEGLLVQGGIQQQVKKDVLNDAVSNAGSVVRVPILRTVPNSAGSRTVNSPAIPLPKGHKLTLRI